MSSRTTSPLEPTRRGAETATHFLGLGDIQGYAADIAEQKEDFVTVLKEMVDTGVIESTQLSPEVRLGLLPERGRRCGVEGGGSHEWARVLRARAASASLCSIGGSANGG